MSVRRARLFLLLAALIPLGGLGMLRPAHAQERPDPLATCPSGSGETLDGTVFDRATRVPLGAADVDLSVEGRQRRATTMADGRFRFCGVPRGQTVVVRASYRSVRGERRMVTGGNGGEPVHLEVDLGPPSNIVVSVTDADTGEPIEGVTLRLEPSVIGGVTNAAGRVGFGRVPPGEYELRANHVAYDPGIGDVFVDPDRPRQLDVALERRIIALDTINVMIAAGECARPGYTTLSGTVVDRRTEIPLEGALVSASRFDDGTLFEHRVQSEEDGTFVFCGVPEGTRWVLQANLGSLRGDSRTVRSTRDGGAIVLEIDHGDPGFVAMSVIDASTRAPVEGAMIRLHPHPLGAISNEKGWVGFREIPPGEYEVRADHVAYASFLGKMTVDDRAAEEFEIPLQPTAISVAPIEVRITGRDPYLLNTGFYDRMVELDEGYFYDYWDMESYATLSTFVSFKTWVHGNEAIFVNGRSISRLGQTLNELPFGKVRGVEHLQCLDLPWAYFRQLDIFWRNDRDCWAILIWRGERRVRSEREPPTDRCADERRSEALCSKESGS